MTTINIFEYASRYALRFPYKGSQSVEDLWTMPVTELDKVFKTLNTKVKQANEESLLSVKTKVDEELDIQIEIVKHIVSVKLAEKEASEKALIKKAQKQKIQSIITKKENEELENSSIDELKKMLEGLDE